MFSYKKFLPQRVTKVHEESRCILWLKDSFNHYPPSGGIRVGVIDGVAEGTGVTVAGTVFVGVGEMVAVGSATPETK